MNNPTIGRIVGYVLPASHRRKGEVVPAIITRVWQGSTAVQLTPFVDVANDAAPVANECSSVPYSEDKICRSWHWLPRA